MSAAATIDGLDRHKSRIGGGSGRARVSLIERLADCIPIPSGPVKDAASVLQGVLASADECRLAVSGW